MDGEASARSYQTDMCPIPVFLICVWALCDACLTSGDHKETGSIYQTADATAAVSRAWGRGAYVCVCACVCVCVYERVKVSLLVYICLSENYWLWVFFFFLVWESSRESTFIRFMHVLEYYIVSNNAQVCVYMCGYLLSSEPRGAKLGRMTLMRCVGMCPRVVLVWLSFCCFSYSSPFVIPRIIQITRFKVP